MVTTRTASYDVTREEVVPVIFVIGLLLLPLNTVQLGIAQPAHVWALLVLPFILSMGGFRSTAVELVVFFLFILVAVFDTVATDYDRLKDGQQIIKFALVYPSFFLIGRWLGARYVERPLPFGWAALLVLLTAEYLLQYFQVPVLYEKVEFMQNAIHGSFRERNWLAIYFFFLAYLIFLKKGADMWSTLAFCAFSIVVTLISESKTLLVACGIGVMLQMRGGGPYVAIAKVVFLAIGGLFYFSQFSDDLSGQLLQVRLEEERGLAFQESVGLIGQNMFGYGLGFVESYFANSSLVIRGLGLGTNSVFSSPLDLMIIAGGFGLLFWAVFFAGVGVGAVRLLAPVAAWSLLDPLHQSEMVYLFNGLLVSWGLAQRRASVIRLRGQSARRSKSQGAVTERQ